MLVKEMPQFLQNFLEGSHQYQTDIDVIITVILYQTNKTRISDEQGNM